MWEPTSELGCCSLHAIEQTPRRWRGAPEIRFPHRSSQYAAMSTLSSTSSRLSASVFPISCVMSFANFCRFPAKAAHACLTSSVRSWRDRAFHKGCAVRAAATAASISDGVETLTRCITAPVAGFVSTMWPCSIFTPWTIVAYDGTSCRRPCRGSVPRGGLFLSEVPTASRSREWWRRRAKGARRRSTCRRRCGRRRRRSLLAADALYEMLLLWRACTGAFAGRKLSALGE